MARIESETPEQRSERIKKEHAVATSAAVVRSAEAKANLFRTKASMPNGEAFKAMADAADADLATKAKDHDRLYADFMGFPVDPEGTAPGLSDATGTFAGDVATANAGGIGVNDSNATGNTNPSNSVEAKQVSADAVKAATPTNSTPAAPKK